MKIIAILLTLIFNALILNSCEESVQNKIETQSQLETLMEEANIKNASIDTRRDQIIPDSMKATAAKWITETIAAASKEMTTSDYEDPEDLVEEVFERALKLYGREESIFFLTFISKSDPYNNRQWIEYKDLSPSQREVFDYLKNR